MSERAFGQRIRQLRLAKSWTLTDLSQLVGLSERELGQLERGNANQLDVSLLDSLAQHLEADVDELYVMAGRLPPCLAWVQADPGVVKLLGAMAALIDRRVTVSRRS